jgi:hypothetical protein
MPRRKNIRTGKNVLQEEAARVSAERKSANEVALVSFEIFRKQARAILNESKEESDKALGKFQAANAKKREARKKRR